MTDVKSPAIGPKWLKWALSLIWVAVLLCLAMLVGCGPQEPERGGNLLNERSLGLVGDAAAQIVRLYPPAKTRLVVSAGLDESDLFGLGLVGKLREAGYAVREVAPESDGRRDRHGAADSGDGADVAGAVAAGKGKGLPLRYVVDEFDGHVRVLVHIGTDALSRVYDVDGATGNFLPAGGWAWRRGEGGE